MGHKTRLLATLLAAAVILSVATPVALATIPATIDVEQAASTYAVTVTHNETPVNDSTVTVTPTDPNASYAGVEGVTDDDGTVTFDQPQNETEVNVTATWNGTTVQSSVTLDGMGDDEGQTANAFGQEVVDHLNEIMQGLGIDSNEPIGQQLSAWIVENNPGADHRSDNANPGGNGPSGQTGQSDHAGTDDGDEDGDGSDN